MRVIAGSRRHLILKTVPGMAVRPTQDRTKETLFNILNPYLADCRFLDLFSGSGAIGIEALSRGATFAVFIENDKNAQACIEDNLSHTKFKPKTVLCKQDAFVSLQSLEYKYQFDIIFMDPPYESGLDVAALRILKNAKCVTEDTLIIVEASVDRDVEEFTSCGFALSKEKKYKTNKHVFLYKED